ncbi:MULTISPECIES: CsgG/HfaB family protein [Anaeromyxobacter]|uniref:CsgG/HfaB family protein n=1 Tax=Anaeromyxobacter TaxID=161492 RepID=UPI001F571E16|nr:MULTISPECIES: CsgG/HfaB family protein [unclassified Anaeromyxobacter]
MRRIGIAAGAALLLQACATVSEKPAPAESPVPKAAQLSAQEARRAPAAKRYKMKLAIARFSNETNYGRSLLNDADLDRIGKQASDMLASRLIMSGNFVVLERPDLQKLEREQQLSGGKLVGADTVITGSVTEFGRSVGGKSGFLSSTKVQLAHAKVDVRLVDVKTGHAYFSAIGAGEASTESGEIAGFGSHSEYDATLNDRAIAAAISDVIDRLAATLADRPWRTDILEVQGAQLFITGGKHQGLREGDTLAVMEAGATVKSKQTGFEVTLPPKQVATLRVVSLFGDSETNEGAACEVLSGRVEPAALAKLFVTEPKS